MKKKKKTVKVFFFIRRLGKPLPSIDLYKCFTFQVIFYEKQYI